jgi:hypothetical protein
MKLSVLTAALQELTPRRVWDDDPDRAVADGNQRVLDAITRSASSGRWEAVRPS